MSGQPISSAEMSNGAFLPEQTVKPHRRMSTRNRLLFFLTAWLIVLMPFLFWWNTWFGRPLSDKQLNDYLRDDKKPRHIQHALVQIGERLAKQPPVADQIRRGIRHVQCEGNVGMGDLVQEQGLARDLADRFLGEARLGHAREGCEC